MNAASSCRDRACAYSYPVMKFAMLPAARIEIFPVD